MEKKILEELKAKLESEKNSIQAELETFADKDKKTKDNWETRYPNAEDSDKDEKADEATEYDNMLSVEYKLELKLKDVNSALEKIEGGTYGICEKCGKEIEKERLHAMPEARLCISCNNKK